LITFKKLWENVIFLTNYSVIATETRQKMKKSKQAGLRSYADILHNYPASFLLYCFSPYHFCMGFFISGSKTPAPPKTPTPK
jgi:hypothetical protein